MSYSRCLMLISTILSALLLPSCGREDLPQPAKPAAAVPNAKVEPHKAVKTEIIISTATSTKEVIASLAAAFSENSKVQVKINPGPSSGLANQILEGAPADLFLSANRQWAEKVEQAGLAVSLQPLLTNKLVLIAPQGNPGEINKPEDLASDKVKKISLAGEKVPAGMYADQALKKLGLLDKLTSAGKIARGQDVRSALSYVERGEAEAGIVYSTDVGAAKNVEIVHTFDPALHDEIVYVLVLLKHGSEKPSAKQFFDFLQSSTANEAYAQSGFERVKDKQSRTGSSP